MSATHPAPDVIEVVWPAGSTTSNIFALPKGRFGSVQAPSTVDGTTLNYLVSNEDRDRMQTVRDEDGVDLTPQAIAANKTNVIPWQCFHSSLCQLTGDEQTAERTWTVFTRG